MSTATMPKSLDDLRRENSQELICKLCTKKRVLKANAKKATNEAELLIKIEIKYFNMENRETTKCYKETVEKEKRELTY